jgi:hypothetical protein
MHYKGKCKKEERTKGSGHMEDLNTNGRTVLKTDLGGMRWESMGRIHLTQDIDTWRGFLKHNKIVLVRKGSEFLE